MTQEKEHTDLLGSWGNYKKINSKFHFITSESLPSSLKKETYIAYGNGRNYGDCGLNDHTLHIKSLCSILSFDTQKGIFQCQSGILLSDIINVIVPEKWFLPVTPGTKYITIGGAVASDVHGKNHHKKGCFSNHILSLKVLLPDNSIITCSKTKHSKFFNATCGGMGLTGIILEVTLQLLTIQSAYIVQSTIQTKNLKDTFAAFEKYNSTYTVAWIDAMAKGSHIGKGLFFSGEHAEDHNFNILPDKKLYVPKWFPSVFLNPLSIKIYNLYYYRKHIKTKEKVSLDSFFYPLDSKNHWNRIYGKKGFMQYQVVIPEKDAFQGINELLEVVTKSKHTSYLTVLKLLGGENNNYLSFPLEGYTIAMDFKVKKGLLPFLNHLDTIVSKYNGRVYLAKDGRMHKAFFEKGYQKLEAFKKIRKQYKSEQLQSLQSKRLGL